MPSKPEAFAYGDLVDRWFAVYDKHYRPQEPVTEPELQIQKYESAWNVSSSTHQHTPSLSLDELKRLAIEGSSTSKSSPKPIMPVSQEVVNEGDYRSMPLEGRLYLVRPTVLMVSPARLVRCQQANIHLWNYWLLAFSAVKRHRCSR